MSNYIKYIKYIKMIYTQTFIRQLWNILTLQNLLQHTKKFKLQKIWFTQIYIHGRALQWVHCSQIMNIKEYNNAVLQKRKDR